MQALGGCPGLFQPCGLHHVADVIAAGVLLLPLHNEDHRRIVRRQDELLDVVGFHAFAHDDRVGLEVGRSVGLDRVGAEGRCLRFLVELVIDCVS